MRWSLVVVLLAGCIAPMADESAGDGAVAPPVSSSDPVACPGHWHAKIDYFVHGERVAFPQGPYQLGGKMPLENHMHGPDDRTWHFEPASKRCYAFGGVTPLVDVFLQDESVTFNGTMSVTGRFSDNATHEWKVYTSDAGAAWQAATLGDVRVRQLADGERVVFVFGPRGDDGAALRDSVGS